MSRPGSCPIVSVGIMLPTYNTLQTSRLVAAKFIQTPSQESGQRSALLATPASFPPCCVLIGLSYWNIDMAPSLLAP